MKSLYTVVIFIFVFNQSFGQIKEKQVNMSLGVQPCLSQDFQEVKHKTIIKLWKKYFKSYGKVKRNRKAKEYYSTGVKVNRIKSGDPIDVYAKFVEFNDGVNVNICVDLGTSFVSERNSPEEFDGVSRLMEEFEIYVKRYVLNEKLKDEEDNLDDFQSDLKSAKKKNKKLHKSIEKYKGKIEKAENDIKENLIKQDDLAVSIQKQTEKVKDLQNKINNIGRK